MFISETMEVIVLLPWVDVKESQGNLKVCCVSWAVIFLGINLVGVVNMDLRLWPVMIVEVASE